MSLDTHADPIAAGRFIERAQAYDLGQYDPWGHPTRSVTFGEAVEAFLAADPRLRQSTRDERRQTLEHLAATLPGGKGLALSAVTTQDLRAFLYRDAVDKHGIAKARPLAASTRAGYYAWLRTFFRWAVKTKSLRDDPSDTDLERPRVERKVPAHLTPADVDRIVEAYRADAGERGHRWEPGALAWFEPVVLFAVNTGMRIGEIVAMRWSDVVLPRRGSGQHGRIYVRNYRRADGTERKTKTEGDRTVPVTAECRDVLETLMAARATETMTRRCSRACREDRSTRATSAARSGATGGWPSCWTGSTSTASGIRRRAGSSAAASRSGSCRTCSGTRRSARPRSTRTCCPGRRTSSSRRSTGSAIRGRPRCRRGSRWPLLLQLLRPATQLQPKNAPVRTRTNSDRNRRGR